MSQNQNQNNPFGESSLVPTALPVQLQCVICGNLYHADSKVLKKHLKDLEPAAARNSAVSGQGICPEHQALLDQGMVALLEADLQRKERLGRISFIWQDTYKQVFNKDIPNTGMAFIDTQTMDQVEALMAHLQKVDDAQTRH